MIRRIYIVYMVECAKAVRTKSTWIGPILITLMVALSPLVQPIARDDTSDYAFLAAVIPAALNVLGLLLLLTYCATLISSELGSGTVRSVLVRPVRRREFLAAKMLMGMTYGAVLTGCAVTASVVVVYAFGDLTGIRAGGEILYTDSEMRIAFLAAVLVSLVPQSAAAAYAVMISAFTRSTSAAITSAVGIFFLIDALKAPLRIDPLLFSSYSESAWRVFRYRCDGIEAQWFPETAFAIVVALVSVALFYGIALFALSRRNFSA